MWTQTGIEAAVERCYEVTAGWVDQCDVITGRQMCTIY